MSGIVKDMSDTFLIEICSGSINEHLFCDYRSKIEDNGFFDIFVRFCKETFLINGIIHAKDSPPQIITQTNSPICNLLQYSPILTCKPSTQNHTQNKLNC